MPASSATLSRTSPQIPLIRSFNLFWINSKLNATASAYIAAAHSWRKPDNNRTTIRRNLVKRDRGAPRALRGGAASRVLFWNPRNKPSL